MMQKLTAKEEEVMRIIWAGGDMFVRDIVARMPEPKPSYNTVATQVKLLEEKGYVGRRPMANSYQYHALVSERDYSGGAVGDMVSKFFNNSYLTMVTRFIEDEKMDLDELRDLIRQRENRCKQ